MIITQNFLDMLSSDNATMTDLRYFLNSDKYHEETVISNFKQSGAGWTSLFFTFEYDARLHFKLEDDRVSAYNVMFMQTEWIQDGETTRVPSFVIEDIHKINSLDDSVYESVENWFILDLSKYNIRCAFNYSSQNFDTERNAKIFTRHWHTTGKLNEAPVIRDVSSIRQYSNLKCLMSRGDKTSPIGIKE